MFLLFSSIQFSFLCRSAVDEFKDKYISSHILSHLLNIDLYKEYEFNEDDAKNGKMTYIYQCGKPVDYFVLIVNGNAELETGKEKIISEIGSFNYFGVSALYVRLVFSSFFLTLIDDFFRVPMKNSTIFFDRNRINFVHLFPILVYV